MVKAKKLVSSWDNNSDIECSVNQEAQPMGHAGSVKLLHERLTQTFIVASGDAVLSSELNLLIDAHKSRSQGYYGTLGSRRSN